MKKLILLLPVFALCACSTSSKSPSRLNCEKLHADSQAKLAEMQQIFTAYQNINYDLAAKLIPPYKVQVDELATRVKGQKQKCWSSEKREIDGDIAVLKDELIKIYGDLEPKKARAPASHEIVEEDEIE